MTEKRFVSEDGCCGYYTEIIDNEKELDLSLSNPKKNLTIEELVDLLNEFGSANKKLEKENLDLSEELDYYKTKCASLETGLFQAERETEGLRKENKELQGKASSWKITASEQIMEQSELIKENAELKENCKNYNWYKQYKTLLNELEEVRSDEKQLGISFMEFKMKLIEKLQIHYDYATEQRQKNLNDIFVTKAYDIIRYDIKKLAEEQLKKHMIMRELQLVEVCFVNY